MATRDEIIQSWITEGDDTHIGLKQAVEWAAIVKTTEENPYKDNETLKNVAKFGDALSTALSTVSNPSKSLADAVIPTGDAKGTMIAVNEATAATLQALTCDLLVESGYAEYYRRLINKELKEEGHAPLSHAETRELKEHCQQWYREKYDPAYNHGDVHEDTIWGLEGEFHWDEDGNVVGFTVKDADGNVLQTAIIEPDTGRYHIFELVEDENGNLKKVHIWQEGSPWDTDDDYDKDYGKDPNAGLENDSAGGGAAGAAAAGSTNSERVIPRGDPLVLDLDGDGIELTNLEDSNAYFDFTGDGFATKASWISPDDGFIAIDKNGDGVINDINELFGNLQTSGFDELTALDSDANGVIDENDEKFSDLMIWQDANGDGVSQEGELQSLQEYNIVRIGLDNTEVDPVDGSDGQITHEGTFTYADGTKGTTASSVAADVDLAMDPVYTEYVGDVTIGEDVLSAGNVKGYGMMPDLHIAMSLDDTLKSTVLAALPGLTAENVHQTFENLLYQWAGVENITLADIDPDARLSVNTDTNSVTFNRAGGITLNPEQLGVSAPSEAWCILQGASPCRVRVSHPPVSSVAPVAE